MKFDEQKPAVGSRRDALAPAMGDWPRPIAPAGTYWIELARVAFNRRYQQEQDDAE